MTKLPKQAWMGGGRKLPRLLGSAVGILICQMAIASDPLVVDTDREITTAMNVGDVTVNANLTVKNVKVLPDVNSTTYLPGTSGLTPQILVTGANGVYNEGATNTHTMRIGANGGMGCLVVSNSANARVQRFIVEPDASDPATPGTNTVLRLEDNGMAVIDNGWNSNSVAVARVVFAGGRMRGTKMFGTANANARWLVEAEPGHDIRFIDLALQGNKILEGSGKIELATDGDIVIGDDGKSTTYPTTQGKLYLTASTNRVIFSHAGDIVLSNNVQLIMQANDCLPCGPANGGIRITKTIPDKDYFITGRQVLPNFMTGGKSSRSNWIDVQDGFMTNATSTTSTLRLGARDDATSFKGHAFGDIVIEKSGTNQLTLADVLLPKLVVKDGPVLIAAGKTNAVSRVADARLEPIPEFKVEGASLTVDRLNSLWVNKVDIASDGELSVGDGLLTTANLSCGGTLATSSSFALRTSVPPPASSIKVRADGGTFKFAGLTCSNHWWRFTFKKTDWPSRTITRKSDGASACMTFSLSKLHMHSATLDTVLDHNTVINNLNFTEDPSYDGSEEDLSGLQPGTITARKDCLYSSNDANDFAGGAVWGSTSNLTMQINGRWPYVLVCTNMVIDPQNPATYVTVAFRLREPVKPFKITGYSLAPSSNSSSYLVTPTDWIVETSPSGKPGTWTVVDERSGEVPESHSFSDITRNYTRYNNKHSYGIDGSLAQLDLDDVQVGGGGLLDVSCVTGTVSVSSLTIDYQSPAGTISKCSFAESGAVRIVNVPDGVRVNGGAEFPLAVLEQSGLEALKTWRVYVNGVENPQLHPRLTADKLVLGGPGMMISFK